MKRTLWPVLPMLLVSVSVSAQTDFRCGGQIIDYGTPATDVLARCGEPTQVAEGSDEVGEGVAIPVEEWLYRFGLPMPTILVFRNGSLAEIRPLNGLPPT